MGDRVEEKKQVVTAGDLAGDYTSVALDVSDYDRFMLQLIWTGTPTGTFVIQTTVDDATWDDLDLDPAPAPAGADGHHTIEFGQPALKSIRIFFDRTSGTGSFDAHLYGRAR